MVSDLRKLKVAFLHPDLGIGGAERLIVDSAIVLKYSHGHDVDLFTSFHDSSRCFEETKNGKLNVFVYGSFFPRNLFGLFYVFFSWISNLYTSLCLIFLSKVPYDVIIVDQIPISIPLLKYLTTAKIIFYCHFPDKLLSKRTSMLKSLYRIPFDYLEETSISKSDLILVNSLFTRSKFLESFRSIKKETKVLYPGINLANYAAEAKGNNILGLRNDSRVILSINRFERKKNLTLAVRSFQAAKALLLKDKIMLILAGGYDERLPENREYLLELDELCQSLNLKTQIIKNDQKIDSAVDVVFLPSFSQAQKEELLGTAKCVLYTPSEEHFGIVPLEAMYSRVPVIAVNSGGPTESIINGETGFLLDPDESKFAEKIKCILEGQVDALKMGNLARKHVESKFSLEFFGSSLNEDLLQIVA